MTISDTFIPVFYHITVANITGAAPANGFIDHQNPQDFAAFPTTLALSESKERGRMRYDRILQNLSEKSVVARTLNITADGADENTEATTFSMTVQYDRPEYVFTEDEENPGDILTGVDAVQRWVSRVLASDIVTPRELYDPTVLNGIIAGPVIRTITAGAPAASLTAANAVVTVVQSDLTT